MKRPLTFVAVISLVLMFRCDAGEIHDAVLKRDLAAIERLLKKDRTLVHAHTFPDYKTPLGYAVAIGDAAIVRRLLAAGADIQAEDADGFTPLLRASFIAGEGVVQATIKELALCRERLPEALGHKLPGSVRETLIKSIASISADETRARVEILSAILAQKPGNKAGFESWASVLQNAVATRSAAAVKLILDAGADANVRDNDWQTPLHNAALCGSVREVFDALIARGARTELSDKLGRTPLMIAAASGSRDAVEVLLAHGARMDAEDNTSVPVLGYAARQGGDEIVKLLHEKGGRALIRDARPDKLFHAAAKGGSIALAELLLAEGVDVNVRDSEDFTPLLTAVEFQNTKLVQLLLEKGADRTARVKDGRDLFSLACDAGNVALVKELIAAGANLNETRAGGHPLFHAIYSGRVEIVQLLIASGVDIQFGASSRGIPPLAMAVWSRELRVKDGAAGNPMIGLASEDDYARIVEILLAHGEKVEANAIAEKTTMMHLAARHCGARVMKALIKAGGNPSVRTNATPLHSVAVEGRAETAKVLLDAGADIRARNDGGETPIQIAARCANSEVMKVLLDHRAPVDDRIRGHQATALHYAANYNSPECVRLLLDAGASVDAKDSHGLVPLVLSVLANVTIETLKEPGPDYDARQLARAHDLKSRLKVIQLLIEGGAKTDIQMRLKGEPMSLIEMARRHGTPEIVELLQNPPPAAKRARKP